MISTHILDTSVGNPAVNVRITLERFTSDDAWKEIANGKTNADGRYAFDIQSEPGKYRLNFFTENYFQEKNTPSFFLDTPVAFKITDISRKYHVPLLLNPFGYSTYRGS